MPNIIERFNALNLTQEEIDKEVCIFNKVYTEYINNNIRTNNTNFFQKLFRKIQNIFQR